MRKSIYFIRPFFYITEKDYGRYVRALVTYERRPYLCQSRKVEPSEQATYTIENIVIQYRHFLSLNLWLVVLDFSWLWPLLKNEQK